MNYTKSLTVAFLAVGMLALTGTAAAVGPQNAEVETTAEANASGNASLQVVIDRLDAIQQKVTQLQNRVSELEAQVAAQGQADARAEAGPGDRPDAAQAKGNNGAEVNHSVEVENGTKTISHEVRKNGNILNQFVKSIFVGNLDGDAEAEAEAEAESEEQEEAEENETEQQESDPEESEEGEDENHSAEAEAEAEADAEVNLN